jgi:hypothetical protein
LRLSRVLSWRSRFILQTIPEMSTSRWFWINLGIIKTFGIRNKKKNGWLSF